MAKIIEGPEGWTVVEIFPTKQQAEEYLEKLNRAQSENEILKAASTLGRIKSERKAITSAQNGKKGGRPKKRI